MSDDFKCPRCGADASGTCEKSGQPVEPMTPPVPNKYWNKIQSEVCTPRWADWKEMEVKIINEYRLNLLERDHRVLLKKHMNDFLAADGGQGAATLDAVAANWTPEGS